MTSRPVGTAWHTWHGSTYGMWASPDKIGRMFAQGQLYEAALLEWVWGQKFTGSTIDVGANIGNHTLWFAKVCGLNVVAFEPVLPHVIRANVHLNLLEDQVRVEEYGLGDEEAEYHHTSKGVLCRGPSDQSTDERLIVRPLDMFQIENPAFIKIDVEGMEIAVLRGGMQTISEYRPTLAVEEWEVATTAEIQLLLSPLGYRRVRQFGGKGRAPMGIWQVAK